MKTILLVWFCLLIFVVAADAQWQRQSVDTKASLRGLSVVNENVIWASGTDGTFLRTVDGGKNWTVGAVKGAEKLDFRDVEAFDAKTAYLLSIGAGETSRIYKTTDGGASWTLQFANKNPKVFLDAFAFWDERNGIAMGDPVDGKFFLLGTNDGGKNWREIDTSKMPAAIIGESAFAASGTCIATNGKSDVYLVTGGAAARVFRSNNKGKSWTVAATPIVSGASGAGIFSIAWQNQTNAVIVGGNYEKPNEAANNSAFTTDGGKTWAQGKGLKGYRSGVGFTNDGIVVAVGSSGLDISADGGKTWDGLDKGNYNAVAAKEIESGTLIWAVGANGLVVKTILTFSIHL